MKVINIMKSNLPSKKPNNGSTIDNVIVISYGCSFFKSNFSSVATNIFAAQLVFGPTKNFFFTKYWILFKTFVFCFGQNCTHLHISWRNLCVRLRVATWNWKFILYFFEYRFWALLIKLAASLASSCKDLSGFVRLSFLFALRSISFQLSCIFLIISWPALKISIFDVIKYEKKTQPFASFSSFVGSVVEVFDGGILWS